MTPASPSNECAGLVQVDGSVPFDLYVFESCRLSTDPSFVPDSIVVEGRPHPACHTRAIQPLAHRALLPGHFISVEVTPNMCGAVRAIMRSRQHLGLLSESEKASITEAMLDDLVGRYALNALAPLRGLHERFGGGHTTYDSRHNLRIGLHLDSWTPHTPIERALASNRVCVNTGERERFFLFAPIRLDEFVASAANALTNTEDYIRDEVRSGRTPIIYALRIDPGCAYIAPTDNLVHDGWFEGPDVDVSYAIRGVIVPKASALSSHFDWPAPTTRLADAH